MKPAKRPLLLTLLVLVTLGALTWRVKRQLVPAEAKVIPFLFASTDEQSSVSPSGRTLYYRFNDAGAAHSGYHFTWCYVKDPLRGKVVVAAGYSAPAVRRGEEPFEVVWHGEDSFTVRFAAGRRDPTITWFSGELP